VRCASRSHVIPLCAAIIRSRHAVHAKDSRPSLPRAPKCSRIWMRLKMESGHRRRTWKNDNHLATGFGTAAAGLAPTCRWGGRRNHNRRGAAAPRARWTTWCVEADRSNAVRFCCFLPSSRSHTSYREHLDTYHPFCRKFEEFITQVLPTGVHFITSACFPGRQLSGHHPHVHRPVITYGISPLLISFNQ